MEAPIRLRRDCVFMKTDDGILFRTRNGPFSLRGKTIYGTFSKLLPHLDGRIGRDAILNSIRAEHRDAVDGLLALLEQRGVLQRMDLADARAIDARLAKAFAPQIDFIAHYAECPNARFLGFRHSKILIAGDGEALAAAGAALLRNGLEKLHLSAQAVHMHDEIVSREGSGEVIVCESPDLSGFDMVLYCSEIPRLAEVRRLNAAARLERCAFLPAIMHEGYCIIGPIQCPDQAGCWMCASLRWSDNASPAEAARFWRRLALDETDAPAACSNEIAARILGNTAAMEVFKYFVGEPRSEAIANVLLQETATLESSARPLVPHGDCPTCMGMEPSRQPASVPPSDEVGDILGRWEPYMGHRLALLGGFCDDGLEQLPLRISKLSVNAGCGEWAFGWSLDNSDMARLAALRQAVERIALYSAASTLRDRAVPWQRTAMRPSQMTGWRGNTAVDAVCRTVLPARAVDDDTSHLIPAGAVLPALDAEGCFDSRASGTGVGTSQDEALRRALLSLAEYCAVRALANDEIAVSQWNRETADRSTGYLLSTAARLSLPQPLIALAECYRGATTALILPADDAPVDLGRIVLATGFSRPSAVDAALTRWLAEEQLRRCGHPAGLPNAGPGHTVLHLVFEEHPAAAHTASREDTPDRLLADIASRSEMPLWLDITPRDVAATQTFHVVRATLAALKRA
jgi:bacteriocin biosynthesis cyclodehydratase domain-containing protein